MSNVHTLVQPSTIEVTKKLATLNLKGSPAPLALGNALAKFPRQDSTPTIGTEFSRGIQLSEILKAHDADETVRDLAILVSQRGVVFFREQDIHPTELRQLVTKLGVLSGKPESSKLHIHPITEENQEVGDEVRPISSLENQQVRGQKKEDRSQFSARNWHVDITFEPVPSDYAILKIHTLPPTGGDTLWASAYEVYDRISPSFAKYLETLEAVHDGNFFHQAAAALGRRFRNEERGSPADVGDNLEAIHPVVRTNPVTGWKGIFVNPGFTKRIVGVTKDESDSILDYLFKLVQLNHDLQVRFKWEKNSLAIWDNRSTFHSATFDYGDQTRIGDRVVSLGEKPYFDPASKSRREALGLKA